MRKQTELKWRDKPPDKKGFWVYSLSFEDGRLGLSLFLAKQLPIPVKGNTLALKHSTRDRLIPIDDPCFADGRWLGPLPVLPERKLDV
jgi:hypothetical protein